MPSTRRTGRKRRDAGQQRLPVLVRGAQVRPGAAEARVLEQALHQLLGRLRGRELVELLDLLAREHQPRLELQQRRDEHEELRRRRQVELLPPLELVAVGEDHVGEVDFQQVELLTPEERERPVEWAGEDVEAELERADEAHGLEKAMRPG